MFPTIRCQNQFPNEFQQPESLWAVINPPERKLAKRTTVHCTDGLVRHIVTFGSFRVICSALEETPK